MTSSPLSDGTRYYCGDHTPGGEHPCLLPFHGKYGCPLHGWYDRMHEILRRDPARATLPAAQRPSSPPWKILIQRAGRTPETAPLYRQLELEWRWYGFMEDWQQLEEICSRWLRQERCECIQIKGKSGDGGVDVVMRTLGGRVVAIQCKRYERDVSPDDIKRFHFDTTLGWEQTAAWRDSRSPHPDHRVFVTTGRYSENAKRSAGHAGIHLVDGSTLAVWCGFRIPLQDLLGLDSW
ncbi:restriction endonuclease [Streptomyces sp. NBC_01298]|uniref:restriction endonuclease n=1 Tax=Streptomyces sp. NBC_01298 TaxID=2903817 RepID=UPI002E0EABAF|nr:restriction endonuclease [Streptomyces sp. NBC_01298]